MSEKERVVNLGEVIGKLPAGAGSLTGLNDDRRNKVNPGTHRFQKLYLYHEIVACSLIIINNYNYNRYHEDL